MDRTLVAAALVAVLGLAAVWLRRRSRADVTEVVPGDVGLGSRSGVGVVGFSSPYCLQCQAWEAALREAGIPFVKVDVRERPDVARRYAVRSTPLVLAVRLPGGEVLVSFDDAPTDGEVERLAALTRGR